MGVFIRFDPIIIDLLRSLIYWLEWQNLFNFILHTEFMYIRICVYIYTYFYLVPPPAVPGMLKLHADDEI